MAPPSGQIAVGALWYKTILQSAECAGDATQGYYLKPDGYETGTDSLNWAIVLQSGLSGYKVRAISNGATLNTWAVSAGLNHGHVTGVQAGSQSLQLLNAAGTVVMGASGGGCVSDGCPEAIWNMNYQVIPLSTADLGTDTCEIGIFYQIADVQNDPTCKSKSRKFYSSFLLIQVQRLMIVSIVTLRLSTTPMLRIGTDGLPLMLILIFMTKLDGT
jgi:hypothetical protein